MADDLLTKIGSMPSYADLSAMRGASDVTSLSERAQGFKKSGLGDKDTPEKVQQAAEEFEALLLHQMFQSMWAAVPQEGLLSGGREGQYFQDMFTEGLAKEVSQGQGIGIKEVIAKELTRRNEPQEPPSEE